jgi:Zn-dependent M28 family amino/carboxypeptidase
MAESIAHLVGFGTRHTLSDATSPTRGIGAARTWIKAQLDAIAAASGRTGAEAMEVSFDRHVQKADGKRVPTDTEIVDVMAVLPGSLPAARDRRYYVVGHYDSRVTDVMDATSAAPGANDDASGVAVVLELAILSRAHLESTVVFLATAGEEQGLYGAKLHAEEARARGWDVRGVLNDDIVGDPSPVLGTAPHDRAIRVFSEGIPLYPPEAADAGAIAEIRKLAAENDSPSRELARFVADVAAEEATRIQPVLVFRADRFLRGGDQIAFAEVGYPALRFTTVEEHYDRQHQTLRTDDAGTRLGDLPEHVDARYLAGVAELEAAVLVHLAQAPSAPANVRVITADLASDTLLRWSPSPEPDVAGYEVVWRATTSATWEHAVDAGSATELRVPINKDDVLFGVRAYDRDGWQSPATFAKALPR